MKKLLPLLLLVAFQASAADLLIEWTAPTEREDGTSLAPSEIESFILRHTANDVVQDLVVLEGTARSHTLRNLENGTHVFQISTTAGTPGEFSDPVTDVIGDIPVSPANPTTITITTTIVCDGPCTQRIE